MLKVCQVAKVWTAQSVNSPLGLEDLGSASGYYSIYLLMYHVILSLLGSRWRSREKQAEGGQQALICTAPGSRKEAPRGEREAAGDKYIQLIFTFIITNNVHCISVALQTHFKQTNTFSPVSSRLKAAGWGSTWVTRRRSWRPQKKQAWGKTYA